METEKCGGGWEKQANDDDGWDVVMNDPESENGAWSDHKREEIDAEDGEERVLEKTLLENENVNDPGDPDDDTSPFRSEDNQQECTKWETRMVWVPDCLLKFKNEMKRGVMFCAVYLHVENHNDCLCDTISDCLISRICKDR